MASSAGNSATIVETGATPMLALTDGSSIEGAAHEFDLIASYNDTDWKDVDTLALVGSDSISNAAFNKWQVLPSHIVQAPFQPVICETNNDIEQKKIEVLQLTSQLKN